MRPERPRARRRALLRGGCVALALFAVALLASGVGQGASHALLDKQWRVLSRLAPRAAAPEVVVVGIDEATRRHLASPMALWHAHLGRLLEAFGQAAPAVVGLDVLLPERSYDDLVPGQDLRLLRGILAARATTRLIAGQGIDETGAPRPLFPAAASLLGREALGQVALRADADGVIRRFGERLGAAGETVPTLAGSMARQLGRPVGAGLIDYRVGPRNLPVSMKQVLDWHAAGDTAALRGALQGKAVLVGSLGRFEDRYAQPVDLAPWEAGNDGRVPGVLIHAQILRTLLDRGPVPAAPPGTVAFATLAAVFLWLLPLRGWAALAVAGGVLAGLFALAALLLARGAHLDVLPPMIVASVAIVGRWAFEAALHLRERRTLRRAFSGYVGPQLLREILAGRVKGEMGGELRHVAVLFADMRGFTAASARLAPSQVIDLLNRYYERVAAIVHGEGGMLNSLMGDGCMAVFGAPKPMANPSAAAYAAAQRLLAMLPALNAELGPAGLPPVAIGIGIHAGEAVVGHVGSRARHEYSAIGDTTNVAARLEQLTKEVGMPLVCSANVAEALGFPPDLKCLGERTIRGREAVRVYGYESSTEIK
jgi:class 3 adenylate cyclase